MRVFEKEICISNKESLRKFLYDLENPCKVKARGYEEIKESENRGVKILRERLESTGVDMKDEYELIIEQDDSVIVIFSEGGSDCLTRDQ